MSRIAYVNGQYVPHPEAAVHVEDRGYQFADGVYEVIAVARGALIDEEGHMIRLERSLDELRIARPMGRPALAHIMREVVRRNRVVDGLIYIQMTRGVAPRDHAFPANAETSVVMTAKRTKPANPALLRDGAKVITIPDIRWERCDIKTVSLLPNCLGKQQAREAGALEAWQVDARDGTVTEGTSTNAWIVTKEGEVVTRKADHAILNGITRIAVLEIIARQQGLKFVERPFTVEEAKNAREAFLTSTTAFVTPIVRIDDALVGDGKPGLVAKSLREAYLVHMTEQAAEQGAAA
ncbi:D-amino-acid transaminase [Microbacterium sp.]|uniref:D-amino-acid transaminase n=1 Tax=Microbacterium sp. TaxID=51671 RepID=UPI0035B298BA